MPGFTYRTGVANYAPQTRFQGRGSATGGAADIGSYQFGANGNVDVVRSRAVLARLAAYPNLLEEVVEAPIDLVVQNGHHGHTADNAGITKQSALVVQDAAHGHLADNAGITKQSTLVVDDARSLHAADLAAITASTALVLADGLHVHRAGSLPAQPPGLNDQIALTQTHVLSGIGDGAHAHTADNAAITKQSALVVADSAHAQTADLALITKQSALVVSEAVHLHTADTVSLAEIPTAGLVGWYDFSALSSLFQDTARTSAISADGQMIKGVTDRSGAGNHLAEATVGPIYKTNIQNSRAVSRWDGTKVLTASSFPDYADSTIFMVAYVDDTAVNQYAIDHGAGNIGIIDNPTDVGSLLRAYAGAPIFDYTTANKARWLGALVVGVTYSSSGASVISVNDVEQSGTTGTTHAGVLKIGQYAGSAGFGWDGDICEVIHYDRVLSASERSLVADYLADKWISPATNLVVADAVHAQVADNAAITKQSTLVLADGQHAHAADLALITKQSAIVVDEARSLHAADAPTLTYSTTLVVADGAHAHAADAVTLFDPYKVMNLNAVAVADDVQLTWDNVTALTGETYEVERDGLVIASGIGTTSYTDLNLASATYTYRVRAVELVGAGGWEPTAFEGGGFQNVISLSSLDPQRMVIGSDVGGTHRSMNGGATWETTSTGIESTQQTRNAAVAHSQVTASRVFMAAGAEGVGGGFFRSDDDGFSWSRLSSVPQFSGSNNSAPLPTTHPRSTGRLIALDEANGYIYVGTFSGGVMRSSDGGVNWTVIWGAGANIRSLVIDPANPQVLIAAVYDAGGFAKAYRLTSIRTTASASQLTALPNSVEELAFGPSGALYAACGTSGIYKSSTSPYTSWSAINTGIETTGPSWQSVAAYNVSGGPDRVWVGCCNPEVHSASNYKSMKFSTDGGSTWADRTVPGTNGVTIDQTIYGETIPWWMFETGANKSGSSLMINKSAMVASQIIVDSVASPPRVFVAGRSGAWISVDEGLTWRPMVHGLLVTIQKDLVVDPADPLRVAAGNTDWTCMASDDGMATINQNRPTWTLQAGGSAMGLWVDFDTGTSPSTLIEGVGDRDNASGVGSGEMFSCQDPANDGAWTNEGLEAYVNTLEGASKRTLGGAVGRNGATRVVVASVYGTGLLRKSGTTWSRPLSLATNGVCPTSETTKYHPMEWPNKTVGRIYWYDRETGIWRSTDFGATWTCVWRAGQAGLPASGNDAYSFMAADPNTVGRIYVCTSTDVYKVDNAHTVGTNGAEATRVQVGSGVIARPGPVRVRDDGAVFVTQRIGTGSPAALWRSTDAGSSWTDVSDEYYRAANILPFQLVIGSDGVMWSANNGNGVTKGL